MATPPDGKQCPALAGSSHRSGDFCRRMARNDRRGAFVDHAVIKRAHVVVAAVAWDDGASGKFLRQFWNGRCSNIHRNSPRLTIAAWCDGGGLDFEGPIGHAQASGDNCAKSWNRS